MPNHGAWPLLTVSYHIKSGDGTALNPEGQRIPIKTCTRPGQSVIVCGTITAPEAVGEYVFNWDMVSEHECWFEACDSPTFDTRICVKDAGAVAH